MRALVFRGPGRKAVQEAPDLTHHFGLEEFDEAYDVFARPASGALKVVLSR